MLTTYLFSSKDIPRHEYVQLKILDSRVCFTPFFLVFHRERLTRHLYYQQLRDNLLNYNQYLTEEQCFLLASYALQADHGNFSHDLHREKYFDPREYLPAWVCFATDDICYVLIFMFTL